MAPCPLNLKECKISFSQVKLASKVEFNFGWHTWKLHYQNCSNRHDRNSDRDVLITRELALATLDYARVDLGVNMRVGCVCVIW